jgi:hypothetical protein
MYFKLSHDAAGSFSIDTSVTDTGKWEYAKQAKDMLELKKQNEDKDFSVHRSIRWRWLFLIISHLVDELYFKDSDAGGLIVGARKVLLKVPQK